MIDIANLKIGDKVHYQPIHYGEKYKNGMVKLISENNSIFIVYNCAGDWKNFKYYTGCNTNIKDLKLGWKHD